MLVNLLASDIALRALCCVARMLTRIVMIDILLVPRSPPRTLAEVNFLETDHPMRHLAVTDESHFIPRISNEEVVENAVFMGRSHGIARVAGTCI